MQEKADTGQEIRGDTELQTRLELKLKLVLDESSGFVLSEGGQKPGFKTCFCQQEPKTNTPDHYLLSSCLE